MTDTDVERGGEGGGGTLVDSQSVDRDVLVHDLLRDTTKGRVYTAVLVEGPIQREAVNERIGGLGDTTIYQTLRDLADTEYVTVDDDTEPYEYTARPVQTHVVSDDGATMFEVTPTFVAVVSASAVRDDIELFLERHSIGALAAAYEATLAYLNGRASRRMVVEEIGLEPYEGITITEEIESVVDEMRSVDPSLADRLGDESGDPGGE
jgi:hypothetical protein